jgi:Holliday junction resolvase RusA-like endonuclease
MNLLVAFWVPERPASFRNTCDSTWWKAYLHDELNKNHALAQSLFGPHPQPPLSQVALSLEILHLHAGGTLRDVDNTAKPIMDAFNKKLYNDDKQIRELTFRSIKFDSEAAHLALQSNQLFRSFLRDAVVRARKGAHTIEHLTFVAFREINPELNKAATGVASGELSWDYIRKILK